MNSSAQTKGKECFMPSTPAGTVLSHLKAPTEQQAWENLLKDAAHMPYRGIEGFKRRGYTVSRWVAA